MSNKFFGQFLLEKGIINGDQLLATLELQRSACPSIGEIAVSENLLTQAQSRLINQKQQKEDKRFGEIAQEMQLLNEVKIIKLLDKQQSMKKYLGEILVEQNMMSQADMDEQLGLHKAERENALAILESGMSDHKLGHIMTSVINTTGKLFERVVKLKCQFSKLVTDCESLLDLNNTCHVVITGQDSLVIALSCDDETVATITSGFLNIDRSQVDSTLASDAFGEFLNIVMGYVLKDISTAENPYLPSVTAFTEDASSLCTQSRASLAVEITSVMGPFEIIVTYQ